jgi:hypothetical protein
MSQPKRIDYLTEDEPIPGQNYVCISFLSPEKIRGTSLRGIKIRGVFATREEADAHCKKLQAVDPDFDVFVGDVGKWLPVSPDPNDAKDQVYQEEQLNDLMKGYKDNLEKSKRMQQQRKNDMIRNGAQEEQVKQANTNTVRDRLRKKLAKKQQQQQSTQTQPPIVKADSELKVKETEVKQEKERIDVNQKIVSEKEQELESIDDKLSKIQQLYNKISNK